MELGEAEEVQTRSVSITTRILQTCFFLVWWRLVSVFLKKFWKRRSREKGPSWASWIQELLTKLKSPTSNVNSIPGLHDKLFRLMRHWLWQRLQQLLSTSSVSAGFSVPWQPTRYVSKIIIILSPHSSRWRFRASLPWVVWWRSFQESFRMQANLAHSCESLSLSWVPTKLWNINSDQSWISWR